MEFLRAQNEALKRFAYVRDVEHMRALCAEYLRRVSQRGVGSGVSELASFATPASAWVYDLSVHFPCAALQGACAVPDTLVVFAKQAPAVAENLRWPVRATGKH
jgi:hypothetical protein